MLPNQSRQNRFSKDTPFIKLTHCDRWSNSLQNKQAYICCIFSESDSIRRGLCKQAYWNYQAIESWDKPVVQGDSKSRNRSDSNYNVLILLRYWIKQLNTYKNNYKLFRSRWPRPLRCGYVTARFLGLRVRIPSVALRSVLCECCVLSGRGLIDGLILRLEESYLVWSVSFTSFFSLTLGWVHGEAWIYLDRDRLAGGGVLSTWLRNFKFYKGLSVRCHASTKVERRYSYSYS